MGVRQNRTNPRVALLALVPATLLSGYTCVASFVERAPFASCTSSPCDPGMSDMKAYHLPFARSSCAFPVTFPVLPQVPSKALRFELGPSALWRRVVSGYLESHISACHRTVRRAAGTRFGRRNPAPSPSLTGLAAKKFRAPARLMSTFFGMSQKQPMPQ